MVEALSSSVPANDWTVTWKMKFTFSDASLDGVVLHSDRSCKAYSLGQYELANTLREDLGIPALIIEADMNDERVYAEEQIHARIDAFMETLANR